MTPAAFLCGRKEAAGVVGIVEVLVVVVHTERRGQGWGLGEGVELEQVRGLRDLRAIGCGGRGHNTW